VHHLPYLLQTSDPLFPTGSYAHSFGLEEFLRLSGASDEAALRDFLTLQILPALSFQELPYLRLAHDRAAAGDVSGLCELDRDIHAWKIPSELRSASLRIASRRLDILLKVAPTPILAALAASIASGAMPGHHLTVSAAQYAAVPLDAALAAYLYQSVSAYCVAALKLIRIGQEAAQRLLTHCIAQFEAVMAGSLRIDRDEAGCFNPLIEIASMRHQFAAERLFIS